MAVHDNYFIINMVIQVSIIENRYNYNYRYINTGFLKRESNVNTS